MYDNILIPIDFDHLEMFDQARMIAERLLSETGRISLLHSVADIPVYAATAIPSDLLLENREVAKRHLEELALGAGPLYSAISTHGPAHTAIIDAAEKGGHDCIVIASHKPGLQDYFLGSTAARVVRHAPCPVHVLR